ncbi:hypothetical protein E2C01_058839 [Portunus trituberculatus]|uniref:Uncharacterized protein n=1 Tax=Portunus trituberculatus TaxID=210409 RepID=A0A5B7H4B2_PORTR|nr:hypothetical protein [Portunus trituberculatus]
MKRLLHVNAVTRDYKKQDKERHFFSRPSDSWLRRCLFGVTSHADTRDLSSLPLIRWVQRTYFPKDLMQAEFVLVRRGARCGLARPYESPYRVLARTPKHFTIDKNGSPDTISLDRLKPALGHVFTQPTPLQVMILPRIQDLSPETRPSAPAAEYGDSPGLHNEDA